MNLEPPPLRRPPSPLPLILAGAALAITAWLAWERLAPDPVYTDAEPRAIEPRGELAGFETTTIRVFESNAPSVVHITSRARSVFTGQVSQGTGTGFVWDERGYVVTNFHVVQDLDSRVLVRFAGRPDIEGIVVGAEPTLDIAVVKLAEVPQGLRPIPVGSSRDLRVGQAVFAIGNPFGLDQTLTTGVVSALDRVIESVAGTPIQGAIQVDAAINPGNSGGPLLDSAGRLIGMNTSILSPTGANAGIGFAVPVDTINRVVPRLIQGDPGTRPALGVVLADYAYRYRGIRHPMVGQVLEGTGADVAGLRGFDDGGYGDVILTVDGVAIESVEDLLAVLDQKELGQSVSLDILRDTGAGVFEERRVEVELRTENQRR
jgi:S1-C subfamily serine protease